MENTMSYKKTMTKVLPVVMEKIIQFIRDINYGEIVITIHDAKVVQIEKREKTRFKD